MTAPMKSTRTTKILAFSSFLATLILAFILIGVLQNQTTSGPGAGIYLLVIAMVGVSLFNMIQIMRATAEKISADDYLQKSFAGMDEESYEAEPEKNEQQKEDEDNHRLDPAVYEDKIIPQQDDDQDLTKFAESLLSNIAGEFDIVQGLFYVRTKDSDVFTIAGKFAYYGEQEPQDFKMGVSLSGQTAKNQKVLRLSKIPENYITVLSGLGSSSPRSLMLVPVIHQERTIGLIELAAFKHFTRSTENLFNELSESIGKRIPEIS